MDRSGASPETRLVGNKTRAIGACNSHRFLEDGKTQQLDIRAAEYRLTLQRQRRNWMVLMNCCASGVWKW